MKIKVNRDKKEYNIDLSKGIDISLPVTNDPDSTRAWYIDEPKIEPVVLGEWVGDVKKGSGVNFYNIQFNPHAHCTHTETAGHVLRERYSINQNFKEFFFWAELVTLNPEPFGEDRIMTLDMVKEKINENVESVIIRTTPNDELKKSTNYSNSNPPYITSEALIWLRERGVRHLMIDLPSVDKEQDGGKVAAHHAFWNTSKSLRLDATITELIYVPNEFEDGLYFVNLQVAPFENDAAPSRPLIFKVK